MKRTIIIDDAEMGKVSDGYHTFDELYAHRCQLFVALMLSHPDISWRSKADDAGKGQDDWFLAGMNLPSGDITYHLPIWMWNWLDDTGIETLERAPRWDGHTSTDVLQRLHTWCIAGFECEMLPISGGTPS